MQACSKSPRLIKKTCAGYFIRQFFGDFRQKFRLATKAADLYQGG
jgi:hypothetical protein